MNKKSLFKAILFGTIQTWTLFGITYFILDILTLTFHKQEFFSYWASIINLGLTKLDASASGTLLSLNYQFMILMLIFIWGMIIYFKYSSYEGVAI